MKALVLAAGKGVRMMPMTLEIPKVLINIAGKPFLYYVLQNLRKAGFDDSDIYVMVSYRKEKIDKFVQENGFDVNLIDQEEILGTGHAVLKSEKFLNENFIVVMGDNLYSASDIMKMAHDDDLVYAAAFESTHPQDYGVLEVKGTQLINIEEKPTHPKSKLVNTGLYKLTPEVFNILKTLKKSPRGEFELTDVLNILSWKGKVKIIKLGDYWIDMSNKDSLSEVEKRVRELV